MQKNINAGERMARVVFGVAALFTVFVDPLSPWVYLGILLWATGIAGWCPLYALFGVSPGSSCK
ncbi:MAG: DUF2892 domain-containing protein [Nitrospirota bacterium]